MELAWMGAWDDLIFIAHMDYLLLWQRCCRKSALKSDYKLVIIWYFKLFIYEIVAFGLGG